MVDRAERTGVETTGSKTWVALLNAAMSALSFGWAMGVLNLPEPYIRCWIYSLQTEGVNCSMAVELNEAGVLDDVTLKWALSTAILPLGAIVGALAGASIANSIGRKKALFFNAIFCIGISVLLFFTKTIGNFWVFIAARFLLGINVGINSSVAPVYINELSPQPYLGAFGSCFQLSVCFGIFLSYVFGLSYILGKENTWPILLGLNAVPGILQVLLALISPESPTYLLSNGAIIEAKQANEALKGENAILDETNLIESQPLIQNIKSIFTQTGVKRATIVVMMLMVFQQLCGINAIFFYSGSIFANAGLDSDLSGIATVGLSIVNVAFVFVAIALSDKAGRKILLSINFAIMAVMAVTTTVLLSFEDNEIIGYISIVPICIFIASFEAGPGPLPWALAGESVPQTYKAGSQSLGVG